MILKKRNYEYFSWYQYFSFKFQSCHFWNFLISSDFKNILRSVVFFFIWFKKVNNLNILFFEKKSSHYLKYVIIVSIQIQKKNWWNIYPKYFRNYSWYLRWYIFQKSNSIYYDFDTDSNDHIIIFHWIRSSVKWNKIFDIQSQNDINLNFNDDFKSWDAFKKWWYNSFLIMIIL